MRSENGNWVVTKSYQYLSTKSEGGLHLLYKLFVSVCLWEMIIDQWTRPPQFVFSNFVM